MKYALDFEAEAFGDAAEFDEFAEESTDNVWELDEYADHECESCTEFEPEFDRYEWEEEVIRGRRVPQRPLRTRPIRIRPGKRRPLFWPRVIRQPGQVIAGTSNCICPAPNCPRHGSEYVRWVQSALNQIMNLRLSVTGIMNAPTRSALRSFQEKQGLPVDGIAGPETMEALIGAKGGKSTQAGATKPAEPAMPEPSEPAATPPEPDSAKPAAEFDFEWETVDEEFEDAGQEDYQTIWLSKQSREFETATPAVPSPKTISRFNTDLNAPYFGGNFNFLYNGGSNEAVITYNTYLSYTKSFSEAQKRQLINNLKQAVAVWDSAAEVQIKDAAGNYNERIRLRFKLNIVTDPKNANKRTQVHPPGSRTVFFMDKDRENVMRDLNIYIGSSKNVLVHELGHVWGLLDEYKDRWISMKLSLGHVGAGSPLINDKISIMNEGYADEILNTGEFRTRYFQHFGRAILGAFWGLKKYEIPIRHNGKTVATTIQGRIALLKRNIAGNAPYPANRLPFNPMFGLLQVAKRGHSATTKHELPENDWQSEFEIPSTSIFNFKTLWSSYPRYPGSSNGIESVELYEQIGGQFARNALRSVRGNKQKQIEEAYGNSCTIRVSHALNLGGHRITRFPCRDNKRCIKTYKSSAGLNYIFRVLDLVDYLKRKFGKPDISFFSKTEALDAAKRESKFKNSKGLIVFLIDYDDASGHFTLWDGNNIAGGTSPKEHYFEKASEIHLWKIA